MAKQTELLSARTVAGNLAAGRYADGGGLYLVVGKSGARNWQFWYKLAGKRREMGLGSVDKLPLKAARIKAAEARETLGRGLDPIDERERAVLATEAEKRAAEVEADKPTFGKFALELLNGRVEHDAKGRERKVPGLKAGFRNLKHAAQWESTLREYAAPLWAMRLEDIDVDNVLKCLSPIWVNKGETARRVRGRIETVLSAAIARRLRPGPNPATLKGNLDVLLPRVRKLQRGHHPAMSWQEIPAFWLALGAFDSVSASALRFTILTAARSGETRGATWGEIDFDAKVWTVPAKRMKAGREHRVPLTDAVVGVLMSVAPLRTHDGPDALVFPSAKAQRPLSDMALSMCLRGLRDGVTVHGFRSSFRDWAGDTTMFPREIAEAALAHTVGGVEGAYRRGDALEKRRALMAAWAHHVSGTSTREDAGIPDALGER